MAETLVDHAICQVVREDQRLTATLQRRRGYLFGATLLVAFGLAPCLSTPFLVFLAGFAPGLLVLPFVGTPFVLLGAWQVHRLRRTWGEVVVDVGAGSVHWTQGQRELGRWKLEQLRGASSGLALSRTGRLQAGFERWLYLTFDDGAHVPVLLGYGDEEDAIRGALRTWGLGAAGDAS